MSYFGVTLAERRLSRYYLAEKFHDESEALPRHDHDSAYLSVVIRGRYQELRSGETIDFGPGSGAIHPAGERHEDRFRSPAELLVLELPPDFASLAAFKDSRMVSGPVLSRITKALRRELRNGDDVSALVVEGLLHELAGSLLRSNVDDRRSAATHPLASRADRLIRERFAESIGLSSISEELDVHPAHLSRVFRDHIGCTVGERIRARRIEHLRSRLASDEPLANIALEAGFADQSHMTRTFKAQTGTTPGEYRQSLLT